MIRNRAVQASLVASAAAVCVLSLAPFAMAVAQDSGGGFSGLLLDRPRCCALADAGERIARGAEGPAAESVTGGRAARRGEAWLPKARGGRPDPRKPDIVPGRSAAPPGGAIGPALVEDAEAPRSETPRKKPADTTEPPRDQRPPPPPVPGNGSGAFAGSPKPAGPDLTVNEERELISRGWD